MNIKEKKLIIMTILMKIKLIIFYIEIIQKNKKIGNSGVIKG